LFGDENEEVGIPVDMRSGSSSEEDEGPSTRKSRDFTVSLLRNNKNLAEPRTSQGVFGPNGKIFVFHPVYFVFTGHFSDRGIDLLLQSTTSNSPSPSNEWGE